MVGTPRVLQILQQEFRSARRTTGLVYDRLANDKEYSLLLHGLWHYQYTRYATDLTVEMQNWLYRKRKVSRIFSLNCCTVLKNKPFLTAGKLWIMKYLNVHI